MKLSPPRLQWQRKVRVKELCTPGHTQARDNCTPVSREGAGDEARPQSEAESRSTRPVAQANPISGAASAPSEQDSGRSAPPQTEEQRKQARLDYAKRGVMSATFKAWFGDWQNDPKNASKVVKPDGIPAETAHGDLKEREVNGKPLLVFHGRPVSSFEEFNPERVRDPDNLVYGPGLYFTEGLDEAEFYATAAEYERRHGAGSIKNPGKTILRAYLNVRNPFDIDRMELKSTDLPEKERAILRGAVLQYVMTNLGSSEARETAKEFDRGELSYSYNDLSRSYGLSRTLLNSVLRKLGYDGLTVKSKDKQFGYRHWVVFQSNQAKAVDNEGSFDPTVGNFYKMIGTKDRGQPCQPGETVARSGCIPMSGQESNVSGELNKEELRNQLFAIAAQARTLKVSDDSGEYRNLMEEQRRIVALLIAANSMSSPPKNNAQAAGVKKVEQDLKSGALVLYHGTSEQATRSIKREGLVPGKKGGGDEWARRNGWGFITNMMTLDRMGSVFATDDRDTAFGYAKRAAELMGGKPVLLKITVPKEHQHEFVADEQDPYAVRFKGKIPPEWITVADNGQKGVGQDREVYGVLVVVEPEQDPSRLYKRLEQFDRELDRLDKSLGLARTKSGSCQQGQTAAETGCSPASGKGGPSPTPAAEEEYSERGDPPDDGITFRQLDDAYADGLNENTDGIPITQGDLDATKRDLRSDYGDDYVLLHDGGKWQVWNRWAAEDYYGEGIDSRINPQTGEPQIGSWKEFNEEDEEFQERVKPALELINKEGLYGSADPDSLYYDDIEDVGNSLENFQLGDATRTLERIWREAYGIEMTSEDSEESDYHMEVRDWAERVAEALDYELPDANQALADYQREREGKSLSRRTKDRGQPCKQGEAAARTGCIPHKETPAAGSPPGAGGKPATQTRLAPANADSDDRGSKDNPIRCSGDIKLAARLLSEGKHIQLEQPDQVSTLVDRMAKMINDAVASGQVPPHFDLCKVSVRGANLFCEESKGIPRVRMPQMRGIPVPGSYAATLPASKKTGKVDLTADFLKHLAEEGIKSELTDVRASHLRASQSEIVGSRVVQLIQETDAGDRDLREKPIFVTRDNYIVDGHHHWAAIIAHGADKGKDYKIPVYKLDMDIGRALDMANEFTKTAGLAPKSGSASPAPAPGKSFKWLGLSPPRLGVKFLKPLTKDRGQPCKQGEAAERTGCIPHKEEPGQERQPARNDAAQAQAAQQPQQQAPKPAAPTKSFSAPTDCAAVKKYLSGEDKRELYTHLAAGSTQEDALLGDILKESGRDQAPELVDQATIDQIRKEGGWVGYRGVSEASFADQFKTGPLYSGVGVMGNGTYLAYEGFRRGRSKAKAFADGYAGAKGATLTVAVPKGAKIISHSALVKEQDQALRELDSQRASGKISAEEHQRLEKIYEDEGRFAALKNYDGVADRSTGFLVLLNRSVAKVLKE